MEAVKIYGDECVDLLTKNQHRIIQKKKGFRFSLDAVLLANFCHIKPKDKIIDLGTGSAIIPLSIVNAECDFHIIGLEILSDIAEMAIRSVRLNQLESKITIINEDLKNVSDKFKARSFDVVICNPPYHAIGSGNINPNHIQAIARHEIACTLEDVVKAAHHLLKETGKFFIVFKPQRFFELVTLLGKYHMHIQKIRFVHPVITEKANSMLIEITKKGKQAPEVMMPFVVYDQNGQYSKEMQQIYFPQVPQ